MVVDLDGLLIDSETWSWQAHNEVLRRLDAAPLGLDEVRRLVGLDAGAEWQVLGAMRTLPISAREYVEAQRAAFVEIRARSLAPMPGVRELLDAVRQRSLRLGLASNSPRRSILGALDGLGIRDRFGAIASVDEVAAGKPAPDVYLLALRRLGVSPEAAIAVEDSATGIAAARGGPVLRRGAERVHDRARSQPREPAAEEPGRAGTLAGRGRPERCGGSCYILP